VSARGADRLVSVWRLLRTAVRKFVEDHGWILASAMAFNLLLYFIPLSLLMISLLGYTVLDSERAMHEVQSALKSFLPRSQHDLADDLAAVVADRGLLGIFGFSSFFVLSTFVFSSARTALNRVFQVKQERTLVKGVGVDLMMIGLMGLLLLLAVGMTGVLTLAGAFAERYPLWEVVLQPGLTVLGKMAGVAATALLFYVLYRFSPGRHCLPAACWSRRPPELCSSSLPGGGLLGMCVLLRPPLTSTGRSEAQCSYSCGCTTLLRYSS